MQEGSQSILLLPLVASLSDREGARDGLVPVPKLAGLPSKSCNMQTKASKTLSEYAKISEEGGVGPIAWHGTSVPKSEFENVGGGDGVVFPFELFPLHDETTWLAVSITGR